MLSLDFDPFPIAIEGHLHLDPSPATTANITGFGLPSLVVPFSPIHTNQSQSSPSSNSPLTADVKQRSMNDEFTGELGAAAEAEGAEKHERHEDGGAATDGAKAAVAVSSSFNRDLCRAKEMKRYKNFFKVFGIVVEMADAINFELFRLSDDIKSVVSWEDIVGDKRKKQKSGEFKIAAIDLFSRTDTAMKLQLTDAEKAVIVKSVQEWIKQYRHRNKMNILLDWQKSLLCEFTKSHGIKFL